MCVCWKRQRGSREQNFFGERLRAGSEGKGGAVGSGVDSPRSLSWVLTAARHQATQQVTRDE